MPEILINDIPVQFPFEPYDVQKNYIQKLIQCLQQRENGVLESPTGTGKTLSLLCGSLAWLGVKKAECRAKAISSSMNEESNNEVINSLTTRLQNASSGLWKVGNGCPKILYSSRTHSQLYQAVNELKRTTYRHFKVAVLGSRDQMCVHPEVAKEVNNHNKVHMCQLRVKGRNCYFYNQVEHKKLLAEVTDEILDIEDLVKLGKKRTFCPYYMARELRQNADIIFLPYNYLLDPKSRKSHGIDLQGNVVIFDEAHNVEKVCEESVSLQIRSTDVALCIDEVTQIMNSFQELSESNLGMSQNALIPEDFSAEDLYILKTIFLELEKAIDEISLPTDGSGVTFGGNFMLDLLQKCDITPNKKQIILDLLEKLIQYLTTNSSSPFQRKGAGLQKFLDLIRIVYSKDNFSSSHVELVKQCYKVHVTVEETRKSQKDGWDALKSKVIDSKKGKILSYWCFNPGFGMKELEEHGIHSIILTSGTLSPLDSFTSELKIPFPIQLENPHIIKPYQVFVSAVSKGPDGTVLNSSYQNRNKPEYLNSLGLTVLNFSRIIPGGLLVFFPSYPIMKSCQNFWQNNGIWAGIYKLKPIFVEPQTKAGFESAMTDFYEKVRDPSLRGACFFAVCRGKVSEGLDFSNQNGRAVIITGIPYPPMKDPKVILKQKYLEEVRTNTKTGLTGSMWYKLEASRAINQAIGRVIRHKDDFGAILLCDKRFADASFKNELSFWIRSHVKIHKCFGPTLKDLIQFFKITKSMFPEKKLDVVADQNIVYNPIKIQYDDNRPLNEFTRPVIAKAFQPVETRPVKHELSKSNTKLPEETVSLDYDSIYASSSSCSNTKQEVKLFDVHEKESSVVDFNDLEGNQPLYAFRNTENIHVVKKRKIKVVNQFDKELKEFIKADSQSTITISKKEYNSTSKNISCVQSESYFNNFKESKINPTNKHNVCSVIYEIPSSKDPAKLKQLKISKYLKEVKSVLSKEEYVTFSEAIKNYKINCDIDCITATLLTLFGADYSRHHLLSNFSLFLQHNHRNQLNAVYQDLKTAC